MTQEISTNRYRLPFILFTEVTVSVWIRSLTSFDCGSNLARQSTNTGLEK
jgi:hypothetical protein